MVRATRFESISNGWKQRKLAQAEARECSKRMFKTLQGRLSAELEERGIVEMREGNKYLSQSFVEDFNRRFTVEAAEEGSAFVPLLARSFHAGFEHIQNLNLSSFC